MGGRGGEMEENLELEEGEAPYCSQDDDDNNIDPESDLSYIDEKVQLFLGHFQKYFDGGVSAENLGANFGGYGSFLPAYERSPLILSHPKTPDKSCSGPKSPKYINVEGARQSLKVPSKETPCVRDDKLYDSGSAAERFSIKLESGLSAIPVARKTTSLNENRTGKLSDYRPLKVRIKVGPDSRAQKNAAILHSLGLDNSPSLSVGNSHDESGGMLSPSEVVADESPTEILQVMTSFPLLGDVLISPLHESLLGLIRKESLSSGKFVKSNQGHPFMITNELGAVLGNGKLLKEEERILKSGGNDVKGRQKTGTNLENGVKFSVKKKSQDCSFKDHDALSNNLESTILSSTEEYMERLGDSACVAYRVMSDDGGGERFLSSDLGKNIWKSVHSQDSGKNERRNFKSSSVEKMLEGRSLISNEDVLVEAKVSSSGNSQKVASSKAYFDAVKSKEYVDIELSVPSEENVGQQGPFGEHHETSRPSNKNNLVVRENKSNGIKYSKKEFDVSPIQSTRGGLGVVPKDACGARYCASDSSTKRLKLKSQKDFSKVRVGDTGSKRRSSGHGAKDASLGSVLEMEQIASIGTSKKKLCPTGDDNLQLPVACVSLDPHNQPTAELAQPATGVVLIHDNWVQCDRCEKWRLLPYGTNSDLLPERWLCSMQTWLPGLNRCEISDKETTEAIHAMYQIPVGQNNIQSDGSGLVSNVEHPDKTHYSLNSLATTWENKKNIVNRTLKSGASCGMISASTSGTNHSLESVKSKSMERPNQPSSEQNPKDKSGILGMRKLQNLAVGKLKDKNRENQINGSKKFFLELAATVSTNFTNSSSFQAGEARQTKTKNKRVVDDCDYGPSKKASKEDLDNKRGNSEKDLERDGASLDGRMPEISSNKRKLRDLQEKQNGRESNSEIGLKKEKKFEVLKSVVKDDNINDALDELDEKVTADKIQLLCSKRHLVDGVEVRNTTQNKLSMKHRTKSTSQLTLGGVDLLRKCSGAQHASLSTTSNSSKVSGSHKIGRPTFDEVRSSPGESVSSSPLRISAPVKFSSAGIGILGKYQDGPVVGGPSAIGEQSSYWHGKENDGRNPSVIFRKEKITVGLRSGSLDGDAGTLEYCNDFDGVGRTHDNGFAHDFDKDKMDPSSFEDENGDFCLKHKTKCASETGSESNVLNDKRINNVKHSIPDKSSPSSRKGERNRACKGSGGSQLDRKSDNQVELEHAHNSDAKVGLLHHNNYYDLVQENLHHDSRDQVNMDSNQRKNKSGAFTLLSQSEVGNKQEHERTLAGSQEGYNFDRSNCDPSKSRVHCEKVGSQNIAQQSLGQATDPTPAIADSSNPTAADVLREAKALREKADRFKDSGFGFESNEVYFQAALKFLHGASLLDSCSGEIARQGDMSQMQVYNTVATLCKCCAFEYESRKDMISAALAYKCMEVAHWRVVFCKNSSSSKDRNELQASLRFLPQGDSPSSSASDIDNFNNPATTDKTSISKSSVSHVAGNTIISARNHSNFLRLLDFTQDVNFAVEASRKSQSAFSATNATAEKAVNRECLSSVKNVVNFSFQDVEALIHQVQLAMKAVNRSGLVGARN